MNFSNSEVKPLYTNAFHVKKKLSRKELLFLNIIIATIILKEDFPAGSDG